MSNVEPDPDTRLLMNHEPKPKKKKKKKKRGRAVHKQFSPTLIVVLFFVALILADIGFSLVFSGGIEHSFTMRLGMWASDKIVQLSGARS